MTAADRIGKGGVGVSVIAIAVFQADMILNGIVDAYRQNAFALRSGLPFL